MADVYLAAKYGRREEMERLSADLPRVGHVCTARWVFGEEEGMTREDIALMDLEDVKNADMCVVFTHDRGVPQPGGGRFVEFGYALGLGKRCVAIGPYENVFIHTPGVEVYDSWEKFIHHEGVTLALVV